MIDTNILISAALDAGADLFLTGDKDFLESSVTDPRIISVSNFLNIQWRKSIAWESYKAVRDEYLHRFFGADSLDYKSIGQLFMAGL